LQAYLYAYILVLKTLFSRGGGFEERWGKNGVDVVSSGV
jgi:hypothetical protein